MVRPAAVRTLAVRKVPGRIDGPALNAFTIAGT